MKSPACIRIAISVLLSITAVGCASPTLEEEMVRVTVDSLGRNWITLNEKTLGRKIVFDNLRNDAKVEIESSGRIYQTEIYVSDSVYYDLAINPGNKVYNFLRISDTLGQAGWSSSIHAKTNTMQQHLIDGYTLKTQRSFDLDSGRIVEQEVNLTFKRP